MRRLLDAGVVVFAQRGYHAARVDDVVKEAQTSHGTFYLYFANKDDLFRALVLEAAGQLRDLDAELPAFDAPDARPALRAWLARFADLYQRYGPVIRAWTEAEIGGSELGRLGDDVLAEFTRVVFERVSDAQAPGLDPGIAALAIVSMIERYNYFLLAEQVSVTRDEMLDTLTTVVLAAVCGPEASRPR